MIACGDLLDADGTTFVCYQIAEKHTVDLLGRLKHTGEALTNIRFTSLRMEWREDDPGRREIQKQLEENRQESAKSVIAKLWQSTIYDRGEVSKVVWTISNKYKISGEKLQKAAQNVLELSEILEKSLEEILLEVNND